VSITNEFLKMVKGRSLCDLSLRHIIRLLGTDQIRDFKMREDEFLGSKGGVCASTNDKLNKDVAERW